MIEPLLSESEILEIVYDDANFTDMRVYRAIEQAVLSKLTEKQYPIAWEIIASKFANGVELVREKPDNLPSYISVIPLYSHPTLKDDIQVTSIRDSDKDKADKYDYLIRETIEGYCSAEGSSYQAAYLTITGYDDLYPMTYEQKDAVVTAEMKGELRK